MGKKLGGYIMQQGYNRSWKSRKANDQGRMFEKSIEMACDHYRIKGRAEINKIPEFFKVTKTNRDGTFEGRFISNAQPDFMGTLADGRAIVFEAKYTSTDRINKRVVTDTQSDYLNNHEIMGAVCGVCVGIRKTYGFIPWRVWKSMKEIYGRQYMNEEELKEYQVKTPSMICFLDYEKKRDE